MHARKTSRLTWSQDCTSLAETRDVALLANHEIPRSTHDIWSSFAGQRRRLDRGTQETSILPI